ncbi:uncharacterized [Tachysurus ichikawai]
MLRTTKKSLAETGARSVVCKKLQDVRSVCRDREQTRRLNGRSVSSFCFCDASLTRHSVQLNLLKDCVPCEDNLLRSVLAETFSAARLVFTFGPKLP